MEFLLDKVTLASYWNKEFLMSMNQFFWERICSSEYSPNSKSCTVYIGRGFIRITDVHIQVDDASLAHTLFYIFHPTHVFLSAIVTTAIFKLYYRGPRPAFYIFVLPRDRLPVRSEWGRLKRFAYSVCGESIDLPHSHAHIGFTDGWWIVTFMPPSLESRGDIFGRRRNRHCRTRGMCFKHLGISS